MKGIADPNTFALEMRQMLGPDQHRNGYTGFVVPALHIGGRVVLTRLP